MAPIEDALIRRRSRTAYELGRLRDSTWRALCVVPFLAVAAFPHQHLGSTCLAVGALFAAVVALSLFGRAPGRAVFPALAAGLVPLAAPIAMCTIGHACGSSQCMSLCLPACCIGGLVAGVLVATRARAEENFSERIAFLAAACLIVALTGAIGCTISGTAGVLGMLGATLLASAPALRTAS